MLRIGWFSTGRGEGSRGFLKLIQRQIELGVLDASIEFVFSNREYGEADGSDQFLELVDAYSLPLVTLSSRRYCMEHGGGPVARHRDSFHREVMRLISDFRPDVCLLAGYMLIISSEMCQRYPVINIHPALPGGPEGTWQQVIWKLIEQEAEESGVMIHVATEVVDVGPVLSYCRFPIRGGELDTLWTEAKGYSLDGLRAEREDHPLFNQIRKEGVRRERPLLLNTLEALSDGRLRVSGGRVYDAKGMSVEGMCLDKRVECMLRDEES